MNKGPHIGFGVLALSCWGRRGDVLALRPGLELPYLFHRLFGVALLAVSVWFLWPLVGGLFGEGGFTMWTLCKIVFFAVLGLFGVVNLCLVDDLALDLKQGIFRRRDGLWPFCAAVTGPVPGLSIVLASEQRTRMKGGGKMAVSVPYQALVAWLRFPEDSLPPFHLVESEQPDVVYRELARLEKLSDGLLACNLYSRGQPLEHPL
jgi:hypothetical protein